MFVFGLAVVVFMGELSIREGICVVCVCVRGFGSGVKKISVYVVMKIS